MQLIITDSMKRLEFGPLQKHFSLEAIKIAARKSLEGLGDNLKSSSKIPSTSLKKLYLTSTSGAGRIIFLLKVGERKSVFVMIRMKNDKQIGENMTIKNPQFKKILERNLDLIMRDLQNGNYDVYAL